MSKFIIESVRSLGQKGDYYAGTYIHQGNYFPFYAHTGCPAKVYTSKGKAEVALKKLEQKTGQEFKVSELIID